MALIFKGGFTMTTFLPTITANLMGHCTNHFGSEHFELAIGVNLTIMLVLTTMLIDTASAFEKSTGYC